MRHLCVQAVLDSNHRLLTAASKFETAKLIVSLAILTQQTPCSLWFIYACILQSVQEWDWGFFYTLIIHNDSKSLFMQSYFRSQALYELFAFLIALCICCSPCAVYRTHGSLQTTSCGIAFALWLMTPKPRKDISGRHRRAPDMNIRAYCCFPGLCSSHSTVSGITDPLSHIFGDWVEQLALFSTSY